MVLLKAWQTHQQYMKTHYTLPKGLLKKQSLKEQSTEASQLVKKRSKELRTFNVIQSSTPFFQLFSCYCAFSMS